VVTNWTAEDKARGNKALEALEDVEALASKVQWAKAALNGMERTCFTIKLDIIEIEKFTRELRDAQRKLRDFDASPNIYDDRDELAANVGMSLDDLSECLSVLVCDIKLTEGNTKRQLHVFEVMDDEGMGIEIPDEDGRRLTSYGWTERDIFDLIAWATFYTPDELKRIIERLEEGR